MAVRRDAALLAERDRAAQHLAPEGELQLDWDDEIVAGVRHAARGGAGVSAQLVAELTIFALAIFVGFEVISKVPTMLHTPLMSGTNAIHGIVLIGAMLVVGTADSTLEQVLGFVAVVFGTVERRRRLPRHRPHARDVQAAPPRRRRRAPLNQTWINVAYLVAAILFIFGSSGCRIPRTARSGNWIARGRHGDRARRSRFSTRRSTSTG